MEKKFYISLFVLTVLTAGGSMLYFSYLAKESNGLRGTEFPIMTGTMSGEYAVLAENMVDRGVFSRSTSTPYEPDAWRTPGYPAFLALFYAVFGDFYPALLSQILTLFATVLLVFAMARQVLGIRWAYALAVVYILLPDTILSASTLLTENLFTLCFMLAIYLCFFSDAANIYVRWSLAGVLLAFATYVRPASIYIVPFFLFGYFAFYLPWSRITRARAVAAALLAAAFVLALAPWYLRNLETFGHFSFASTGSFVLFRQNATQFYEGYNGIPNLEARYTLLARAGLPPGPVPQGFEHAEALQEVAVDVITEHPFSYAVFHATSFIQFFTSSGAQNYWFFAQTLRPFFNPEPEPSLLQALHPFSVSTLLVVLKNHGWTLVENAFWGVITVLVLLGLWKSKDRRLAWVFFTLVMYFALVTGPIAHARYRMPVEPLLLISAFSTALYFLEKRQGRRLTAREELEAQA